MSRLKEKKTKSKLSASVFLTNHQSKMHGETPIFFLGRMSRMKNSMCPRALLLATANCKRIRGRQHRTARDSGNAERQENGRIHDWLKHSKDAASWEHMVNSMVFRDRSNNSSDEKEEDDETDEEDDEVFEGLCNEPSTQVLPQTPKMAEAEA